MPPIAIYRLPTVARITGLSKATIYRLRERGEFPQPVQLSPRCVGWRVKDIEEWLEARSAPDPVCDPLEEGTPRASGGTSHTCRRDPDGPEHTPQAESRESTTRKSTLDDHVASEPRQSRDVPMRKEYDMTPATQGAAIKTPGKARVTVLLDRDVVAILGQRARHTGRSFQTVLNRTLREYVAHDDLDST